MGGTSTSQQSVLFLVNTGNRLVNFWQKFGKQWELESLFKIKRTVLASSSVYSLETFFNLHVLVVVVQSTAAENRLPVL